jgi:hypothetical protein
MAQACLADCQFYVAGWEYRVEEDPLIRWPADDSPLHLHRELGNKHDKNAVMVMSPTGAHLGYVPSGAAATLAPLLFTPSGQSSEDLLCQASAVSGNAVHLRVYAEAGADVPTSTVRALADFAKRFLFVWAARMIADRTARGQACLADCQFSIACTCRGERRERHWPADNTSSRRQLQLARDLSNNQIDSNAIMVLEAESCALLGFVPSGVSALLAPLLFLAASGKPNTQALWTYACAASGTAVRLRVFAAADGAGVPPEVGALAAFAALYPPPASSEDAFRPLRLRRCPSGWVTLNLPADHLEELLAVNTPSSCWCAGVSWLCARLWEKVLPPESGKWLLYVSPSQQDATWADIVRAVAAGLLGPSAKTAPPNGTSGTVLFCVYTCDWNARDDVLRVGLALQEATRLSTAGAGNLSYQKTDTHTLAGAQYSASGSSVCCYRLDAGAEQLSVDENVVRQALHGDGPPMGPGAAGPSQAAQAQPAKRPRTTDAVPGPADVVYLCDSD